MATLGVRASVVDATNNTWSNQANAVDGSYGGADSTFADWTDNSRNTTAYIDLGWADSAFSSIPDGSTINSVTVYFKHYESHTGAPLDTALTVASLYDGGTQIGSSVTTVLSTSSTNVQTITDWSPTLTQIKSTGLFFRAYYDRTNSTTSSTCNIGYVDLLVDYTAPTPTYAYATQTQGGTATAYAATTAITDAPLLAPGGGVNFWRGNACFDADVSGWDGNASASISWDGAEGRSSLGSLKVVSTEGDVAAARVMQTLAVNNVVDLTASTIVYSFWIKTTTATSVTVAYQGGYGTSVIVVTGGHAVTAGQWSRVDYAYQRSDLGLNGVRFGFRTATADTYWVDDFMVEYKAAEPASDFVRPGAALPSSAHVKPSAGVAAGSGVAHQPTIDVDEGGGTTNAQAVATQGGTATAYAPTATVEAFGESAAATGTAYSVTGAVESSAEAAAGTGAAFQPTIDAQSSGETNVNAGVGAAVGAAEQAGGGALIGAGVALALGKRVG